MDYNDNEATTEGNARYTRAADVIHAAQKDALEARYQLKVLTPLLLDALDVLDAAAVAEIAQHQSTAPIVLPALEDETGAARLLRRFLLAHLHLARGEALIAMSEADFFA